MITKIRIKRTIIHSDYFLMNHVSDFVGGMSIVLSDRHSNDRIDLNLTPEEVKRLHKITSEAIPLAARLTPTFTPAIAPEKPEQ